MTTSTASPATASPLPPHRAAAGRRATAWRRAAVGTPLRRGLAAVAATATVAALLVIGALPAAATGASLYAYTAGGATSPAGCPQTGTVAQQCTLTQALALAAAGDVVVLADQGSYVGNWVVNTPGTTAADPVSLQPAPGLLPPLLDGNGGNSAGCTTASCGGAVLTVGAGVHFDLSGVIIHGAAAGGVAYGAGLANNAGGTVQITNTTFSSNVSSDVGGAIGNGSGSASSTGTLTVKDSTFVDNSATSCAGAIANGVYGSGTVTIDSSTFVGNTAPYCGGEAITNGYGDAGPSTLIVTHATFTGDNSRSIGSGLDGSTDDAVTVGADIFGTGCLHQGGSWTDMGYNVGVDGSCLATINTGDFDAGAGLTSQLGPLAGNGGTTNTVALLNGNPAIDRIPASFSAPLCPTVDQRGVASAGAFGSCDSGAVQLGTTVVIDSTPPDPAVVGGSYLVYTSTTDPTLAGNAYVRVAPASAAVCGVASGSSTVYLTAAGTCTVEAYTLGDNQTGTGTQLPVSVTQSFTVTKIPQTITFTSTPPANPTYGGSYALSATGGGSGNPVTFTVDPTSTAGACTMPTETTVTFTGTGGCTIDAHQDGNVQYAAAPVVQQSMSIGPAVLTVTASSPTVTYGAAVPTIAPSYSGFVGGDGPSVVTAPPACTTTYLAGDGVGGYPTSCTGGSAANYTLSYVSGTVTVDPAPISVTVTGSQPYGSASPRFAYTASPPAGVTISGTVSCGTVDGGALITATLAAGDHTIDAGSCSGLGTSSDDYAVSYVGGTFSVSPATTVLLYTGGQTVTAGTGFTASAVLTSAVGTCTAGLRVTFTVDPDPTGATGTTAYSLGTATTGTDGTASLPVSTAGWQQGVYTISATFAGTVSCTGSADQATLTVAGAGDTATGGGWYSLSGSGRVNFGFVVHQVPHSTPAAYTGQFLLINNDKWRLKGALDSYVATGGSGSASGTGTLYWWNPALDGGLGDWQLASTGVGFTASFTAGGGGKHSDTPGSMGVHIDDSPIPPQPPTLPNSSPQQLKGGAITMS